MTAPRRIDAPTPQRTPLTVEGAADLVARELRHYDRVGAFAGLEGDAYQAVRRAQRVLFAAAAELRDPITHRPCCRQAARASRPGRRP
jgi:hypothetical protein